jgi:hypothetical protein
MVKVGSSSTPTTPKEIEEEQRLNCTKIKDSM